MKKFKQRTIALIFALVMLLQTGGNALLPVIRAQDDKYIHLNQASPIENKAGSSLHIYVDTNIVGEDFSFSYNPELELDETSLVASGYSYQSGSLVANAPEAILREIHFTLRDKLRGSNLLTLNSGMARGFLDIDSNLIVDKDNDDTVEIIVDGEEEPVEEPIEEEPEEPIEEEPVEEEIVETEDEILARDLNPGEARILTYPAKTKYISGELLDLRGLELLVKQYDQKVVRYGYMDLVGKVTPPMGSEITSQISLGSETQNISINIEGIIIDFPIQVEAETISDPMLERALAELHIGEAKIITEPRKLSYNNKEALDLSGIEIISLDLEGRPHYYNEMSILNGELRSIPQASEELQINYENLANSPYDYEVRRVEIELADMNRISYEVKIHPDFNLSKEYIRELAGMTGGEYRILKKAREVYSDGERIDLSEIEILTLDRDGRAKLWTGQELEEGARLQPRPEEELKFHLEGAEIFDPRSIEEFDATSFKEDRQYYANREEKLVIEIEGIDIIEMPLTIIKDYPQGIDYDKLVELEKMNRGELKLLKNPKQEYKNGETVDLEGIEILVKDFDGRSYVLKADDFEKEGIKITPEKDEKLLSPYKSRKVEGDGTRESVEEKTMVDLFQNQEENAIELADYSEEDYDLSQKIRIEKSGMQALELPIAVEREVLDISKQDLEKANELENKTLMLINLPKTLYSESETLDLSQIKVLEKDEDGFIKVYDYEELENNPDFNIDLSDMGREKALAITVQNQREENREIERQNILRQEIEKVQKANKAMAMTAFRSATTLDLILDGEDTEEIKTDNIEQKRTLTIEKADYQPLELEIEEVGNPSKIATISDFVEVKMNSYLLEQEDKKEAHFTLQIKNRNTDLKKIETEFKLSDLKGMENLEITSIQKDGEKVFLETEKTAEGIKVSNLTFEDLSTYIIELKADVKAYRSDYTLDIKIDGEEVSYNAEELIETVENKFLTHRDLVKNKERSEERTVKTSTIYLDKDMKVISGEEEVKYEDINLIRTTTLDFDEEREEVLMNINDLNVGKEPVTIKNDSLTTENINLDTMSLEASRLDRDGNKESLELEGLKTPLLLSEGQAVNYSLRGKSVAEDKDTLVKEENILLAKLGAGNISPRNAVDGLSKTEYDVATNPSATTVGNNNGFYKVDVTDFKFHEGIGNQHHFGLEAKMVLGIRLPKGAQKGDKFTLTLPPEFRVMAILNSDTPIIKLYEKGDKTKVLAKVKYLGGTPDSPNKGKPDLLNLKHYLEGEITQYGQDVLTKTGYKGEVYFGNTFTSKPTIEKVDGSDAGGIDYHKGLELISNHWTSDALNHSSIRKTFYFENSYNGEKTKLQDQSTLLYSDRHTHGDLALTGLKERNGNDNMFFNVEYVLENDINGRYRSVRGNVFNGVKRDKTANYTIELENGNKIVGHKLYKLETTDEKIYSFDILNNPQELNATSSSDKLITITGNPAGRTLYLQQDINIGTIPGLISSAQQMESLGDNHTFDQAEKIATYKGTVDGGQFIDSYWTQRFVAEAEVKPSKEFVVAKIAKEDRDGDGVKEKYLIKSDSARFDIYKKSNSGYFIPFANHQIETKDGILTLSLTEPLLYKKDISASVEERYLEKNVIYKLVETKIPDGFNRPYDTYVVYFKINDDDSVVYGLSENEVNINIYENTTIDGKKVYNGGYIPFEDVVKKENKLVLNKVDSSGNLLDGAKFDVINLTTGESFEIETKDGKIEFAKSQLPDGKYKITEIKAPDGYELPQGNRSKIFWVKEGNYYKEDPNIQTTALSHETTTFRAVDPHEYTSETMVVEETVLDSMETVENQEEELDVSGPLFRNSNVFARGENQNKTTKVGLLKTSTPEIYETLNPTFRQVFYINPDGEDTTTLQSHEIFSVYPDNFKGSGNSWELVGKKSSAIISENTNVKVYKIEDKNSLPKDDTNKFKPSMGTEVTGLKMGYDSQKGSYQVDFENRLDNRSTYVVVVESGINNISDDPVVTGGALINTKGQFGFPVSILPNSGSVIGSEKERAKAQLIIFKYSKNLIPVEGAKFVVKNDKGLVFKATGEADNTVRPYKHEYQLPSGHYTITEPEGIDQEGTANVASYEKPNESWDITVQDSNGDGVFELDLKTESELIEKADNTLNSNTLMLNIYNRPVQQEGQIVLNLYKQDGTTPLLGGEFVLINDATGIESSFVNVKDPGNGQNTNRFTFDLPANTDNFTPGSYTIKQTVIPTENGEQYENKEIEWKVRITKSETDGKWNVSLKKDNIYISNSKSGDNSFDVLNRLPKEEPKVELPPAYGTPPTNPTNQNVEFKITNTKKNEGGFTLNKTDGTNPLKGAKFELVGITDKTYAKTIDLTDKTQIQVNGLPIGRYILKEKEAPSGYSISDKTWEVEVSIENGEVVTKVKETGATTPGESELTVANKKVGKGEFIVHKTDDSEPKQNLPGVEFSLYKDLAGNPIVTKITGEDGRVKFDNLETGTYYLKETKGKEGYDIVEKVWKVVVAEDGSVTITELSTMGANTFSEETENVEEILMRSFRMVSALSSRARSVENDIAEIDKTASPVAGETGQYDVKLTVKAKGTANVTGPRTNFIFLITDNKATKEVKSFLENYKDNGNVTFTIMYYDSSNTLKSLSIDGQDKKIPVSKYNQISNISPNSSYKLLPVMEKAKTDIPNTTDNKSIFISVGNSIPLDLATKKSEINNEILSFKDFYIIALSGADESYWGMSNLTGKLLQVPNYNDPQYGLSLYYKSGFDTIKTNLGDDLTNPNPPAMVGIENAKIIDSFNSDKFDLVGGITTSKGTLNQQTGANSYTVTGINLGAGETVTVTYRLKAKVHDGGTYKISGTDSRLEVGTKTLDFPNPSVTLPIPSKIGIVAKVHWNPISSSFLPDKVGLTLKKVGNDGTETTIGSKEASSTNQWQVEWPDQDGSAKYKVEQEFTTSKNWNLYGPNEFIEDGKKVFSFTNTEKGGLYTSVRATVRASGTDLPTNPVKLQLLPVVNGNVGSPEQEKTVTLGNGPVSTSWDNLPNKDTAGNLITYKVQMANKDAFSGYEIEESQEGNNYTFHIHKVTILEVVNSKKKPTGKFEIIKVDEKGQSLEGAEFTLSGGPAGFVAQVKSPEAGSNKILFENLKPGVYVLKETKAPEGYELSKKEWKITVSEDGTTGIVKVEVEGEVPNTLYQANSPKTINLKHEKTTISHQWSKLGDLKVNLKWDNIPENERKKVKAKIVGSYKYEEEDISLSNSYIVGTNAPAEPLEFGITDVERTWNNLRHTARANHGNGYTDYPIDYLVYLDIPEPLPEGWKINYSYSQDKDQVDITIFKDTKIGKIEISGDNNSFTITNKPVKVDVEFTKKGPSEENPTSLAILPGVKFQLLKLKEGGNSTNEADFENYGIPVVSDVNGKIKFTGLPSGHYRLKEIEAIPGYYNPGLVREFKVEKGKVSFIKIDQQGDQEDLTIINEKETEVPIKIIKKDEENKVLQGVKFKLEGKNLPQALTGTTNAQGELIFDGYPNGLTLPQGLYYLTETQGLPGYIVDGTPRPILISGDFTIPQVDNPTDQTDNITMTSKYYHFANKQYSAINGETPTIRPNNNQGVRIDTDFDFSNAEIKPGDYFKLYLSKNINPQGDYDVERLKKALVITGGQGILASGEYVENDGNSRYIKFTFTKLAKLNLAKAEFSKTYFIDRQAIKNDTNNVSIGYRGSEKTIHVDYTPTTTGQNQYGYNNGNTDIGSFITHQDTQKGTYRQIIYMNKNQKTLRHPIVTIGPESGSSSSLIIDNDTKVKVYKVIEDKETVMPNSWGVDIEEALRTGKIQEFRLTPNISGGKVTLNFGDDYYGLPYIIVAEGKYNKDSNTDLRITSELKSRIDYTNGTYDFPSWTWTNVNVLTPITSDVSGTLIINVINPKNKIEFTKVDGSKPENPPQGEQGQNPPPQGANQKPLEGAEFELRRKNEQGEFVKVQGSEKTTGEDGKFGWKGLAKGEYEVWETKAPAGYIKRDKVASFEVDEKGNIINIKDKDGNAFTGNMYIENFKAEYPSTGGMGTIPFIFAGVFLMAYAIFGFKRRLPFDIRKGGEAL